MTTIKSKKFILRPYKKGDEKSLVENINDRYVYRYTLRIENHKAEIGYWLGRKHWNKGIITEAVKLVTKFRFDKLKLRRITAHVFAKNNASVRVLEKNGYKLEGLLIKDQMKDEKFIDALLYAKVK